MSTIKKHLGILFLATFFLCSFGIPGFVFAKDITVTIPEALEGLSLSGLAYVDYSNGVQPEPGDGDKSYNDFTLTRGYITLQKTMLPWMSARFTLDIHKESDTGDYNERVKYLYAELRPADIGFLTQMKSEIGLGHIPWLDFEEHINPYRCQGTMAIERAHVFNSADTGISIRGNLGGRLEDAKAKTGNSHYDGRWGSWHVGVYNGPGYHGTEKNNNKLVEGRLTLRPLPDTVPGLQLSYFGVYGEGNEEPENNDCPDYTVNLGMLSYEHPWVTLTAQYFATEGNKDGKWIDSTGEALDTEGYSLFADVKLPIMDRKVAVFARYDHFDMDDDSVISSDAAYDPKSAISVHFTGKKVEKPR